MLSARWVPPILRALEGGPLRRNALRHRLGPVSDKILTETLRRMEANRLVIRTAVATVPVEVDYALTQFALNVWPILHGVQQWVESLPPEGFGGRDA